LDNIDEVVVLEAYNHENVGRPPRKPIAIFKALKSKEPSKFQATKNCIGGYGMINTCEEICDIEAKLKPNHPVDEEVQESHRNRKA
jgi:hypothetical protein